MDEFLGQGDRFRSYLSSSVPGITKSSVNGLWAGIWKSGIARKIANGYALAIGIATLGTTIGLIVGDYYQKQAQAQLTVVRKQQALLNDLDKEILKIRSHPQRLMMVFGDSIWFEFERSDFLNHVRQAQELTTELDAFIERNPAYLATAASELKNLIQKYKTNTEAYASWSHSFWQQVNPGNLTQQNIPVAQQALLAAIRRDPVIGLEVKFDRLAEQLNRVLETAQKQQATAETQLATAETLRLQIVLISMAIAATIAATLAFYTSRAIAQPIEAVTHVAQQVTRESNYHLQAPVLSNDEVSVLAISFNSLIRQIAEHTHALKVSHQTLEDRVEERTQELQQALEHFQKAQLQLVQAEKMSSLGQLVAGVAHEINNPVSFIHGNLTHANQYTQDLLELLKLYRAQLPHSTPAIQAKEEDIELEFLYQDLPKLLQSMKVGAERIQEIVRSLRNFSRLDEAAIKAVNIHEGLDSTLMILQSRLKAKPEHPAIQVIKEYGVLPTVECYAGQLNQVFMNILANAIDALDDRDTQRSHVAILTQPSTITIRTQVIDNTQVAIYIADNGVGMTAETQQRLFDPFFTTKPVGKGTGMGMSISYQIITERHGGSLECISKPGQGTEFVIKIPTQQTQ